MALSGHNDRAFSRSYLLLKLDTSPLVMSKNAHVMGILYSIIGAYHICCVGICLLDGGQSRPRKRSQVDNKRSVPTPFLYLLLIAKPWGQCGIEVAHDTDFSAIIMNVLLGIIIIGAGVTIAYYGLYTDW